MEEELLQAIEALIKDRKNLQANLRGFEASCRKARGEADHSHRLLKELEERHAALEKSRGELLEKCEHLNTEVNALDRENQELQATLAVTRKAVQVSIQATKKKVEDEEG